MFHVKHGVNYRKCLIKPLFQMFHMKQYQFYTINQFETDNSTLLNVSHETIALLINNMSIRRVCKMALTTCLSKELVRRVYSILNYITIRCFCNLYKA